MNNKHALVTGGAGFIGSHVVDALLHTGWQVTAIDNFDPYYAVSIKKANIRDHLKHPAYTLIKANITDANALTQKVCGDYDVLIHLAAKAGVRPSIKAPLDYQNVNVIGTQNLLDVAKRLNIPQFVFASSSSVYGGNPNLPWQEDTHILKPISPYASSKVAAELIGHVYAHLYNMRFVGLRLFTVYGPRQRPDLAIHKFAKNIIHEQAIPVFGDGTTERDYTFVEDIVQGIMAAVEYDSSKYEIINLGNHRTISLKYMIEVLENTLGKKAIIKRMPMQAGDVYKTYADISKAKRLLGYQPSTTFEGGIEKFKDWLFSEQKMPLQLSK